MHKSHLKVIKILIPIDSEEGGGTHILANTNYQKKKNSLKGHRIHIGALLKIYVGRYPDSANPRRGGGGADSTNPRSSPSRFHQDRKASTPSRVS